MTITNFIPEIWSAAMLELWVAQNVFPSLVNREYEGLATRGNTVHITGVVIPTVHDYKAAGRVTSADAISDTGIDLLIDQEKVTDFYVDDIDRAQAVGALTPFRVVTTNHLPAVNTPQFVAWNMRSAAFVSQIDQVEALRAIDKFADRVRALHVYGGKIIRPTGVQVFNPAGA
jgi:hypothetical protein